MPTFILNDKEIPFEPGDTVIRAAWRAGHEIPHYCWHPGLSVAANCRMCLVEVKSGRPMALPVLKFDEAKGEYVPATKPKLQPACQLPAEAGMNISSVSDEASKAQASTQEFLLLNHPVDCPICDQAGECKLQDYYESHMNTEKRKDTEPVHKPKGERFGPTIVYDGERCIMCTRCIRVCDELVGDHVLDMRERGNKNEIILAPGRELDHDYTLMTEHVCPVGALTSRDFRFKARVWFLKTVDSVCPGCATGCNTHIDYDRRTSEVHRLRPRDNEAVNKYWMCDDGMLMYKREKEDRVLGAQLGRGGSRQATDELSALQDAAKVLATIPASEIAFVLNAQESTESNRALVELAQALGGDKLYLAALPAWQGDKILRHQDQNPNRRGAILAAGGKTLGTTADLFAQIRGGAIKGAVFLGWALEEQDASILAQLQVLVNISSRTGAVSGAATHTIPCAGWSEAAGTFVNAQDLAQSFVGIAATTLFAPAWQLIGELAKAAGKKLPSLDLKALRESVFPAAEAAE